MSRYRKEFVLSIEDIDLIETALRKQQASDLRAYASFSDSGTGIPGKSQEIQALLGKLHEQKVFYSHASEKRYANG